MIAAHPLYFAEKKIDKHYDYYFPNEPVEKTIKFGGKLATGVKGTFTLGTGELLKKLGIDVSVSAEPHADAEFTVDRDSLYRTSETAKLLKIIARLSKDSALVDLSLVGSHSPLVKAGAPVVFNGEASVDTEGRPEKQVREDGHILFHLKMKSFALRIRSSLVNMETPNAWLRLQPGGSSFAGFGTIVNSGAGAQGTLEIDPIVLAYG